MSINGIAAMRRDSTLNAIWELASLPTDTALDDAFQAAEASVSFEAHLEFKERLLAAGTPDDDRIRKDTGAELIRRIVPGGAVTHDFRGNRVTIAIDPAGKVVEASCG